MISRLDLLADLKKLLVKLQDDLRARCAERPEVEAPLRAQYDAARAAKRTAESYESWREDQFAQATVAWILSCVFIRFLEDNGLLGDIAHLSGPGPRLALARDQHTLYFRQHPTESDREYLYHVFRTVRALPGMTPLFDDTHNPVWRLGLSGDGAQLLLEFWQKLNAEEGQDLEHAPLVHDFSDPNLETRFLGDLYQDLSDEAKKRYALLQTPEFIEEFILDRTLTPAIETFDYQHVRMIDPTCGSAHFLLGGFHRLFALHQRNHPAVEVRALAQRALDQVFGVDLNPNVVAIARFRLLLAALKVSGVDKLKDAPAFQINVGTGDTLLHGPGQVYLPGTMGDVQHHYEGEDADLVRHILGQRYHAVVGNPPYVIVKDKALNLLYRERFGSCHRQFSLAVPFMEVFFALAVKAAAPHSPAGHVGMITANSFMKREFGKKLIEEYIPQWNLTHVIDTAGAYIPGHGTPTVILFGNNQPPVSSTIRTVLGIRGEPATPGEPALGLVWQAILRQIDEPGSVSEWMSATDSHRASFHQHPWSIGGGGASELKQELDGQATVTLDSLTLAIGRVIHTGYDPAYLAPRGTWVRYGIPPDSVIPLVEGQEIRHWEVAFQTECLFPYDSSLKASLGIQDSPLSRHLWCFRVDLRNRREPGGTHEEIGLTWFEWSRFQRERFTTPELVAMGEIATHNHFALTPGRIAFNRPAPILRFDPRIDHGRLVSILGLLNSSAACFWLKQVCHNKGSTVDEKGARQRTAAFEDFYAFNATQLGALPIPKCQPTQLPTLLVQTSTAFAAQSPRSTLVNWSGLKGVVLHTRLATARAETMRLRRQLIAFQEELDWQIYETFGLLTVGNGGSQPENQVVVPTEGLELGERAFEIVMARKMAGGEWETTWFERHRSTPITELPRQWPQAYRRLVERRIELIESDRSIRLIEQPEYKRRWNTEPWEEQQERALREWLLNRLEDPRYWPNPELTSCAHLADKVRRDTEFMTVANLYRNRTDYDLTALVVELVESEAVPFLSVLRYKPSGLRKREVWEQTWAKQREEDAIDARMQLPEGDPNRLSAMEAKTLKQQQIGDIPVPPKYDTKDFLETTFWRMRGKLDVPKERFIVYPHCNRDADRTPVIGWAGWEHLQQAQAVAGYYERMRTNEGWSDDRLLPLLAGVLELLPWLIQWSNALDPQYGMGLGDFYRTFAEEEARRMGKTLDEVRAWQPPAKAGRKKKGT